MHEKSECMIILMITINEHNLILSAYLQHEVEQSVFINHGSLLFTTQFTQR